MIDINPTSQPERNRMTSVTVQIPVGSEGPFAKLVEAWRDALSITASAPTPPPSRADLVARATEWWKTLSANERAIWSLWIEHAPALVPASQIVEALGLKSTSSIKGVVNRMVAKGRRVGFQVGWQSHAVDPLTKEKLYGVRDFGNGEYAYDQISITGVEYAELVNEARTAANRA